MNPRLPASVSSESPKKIMELEVVYEVTGQYDIATVISASNVAEVNRCVEEIRVVKGGLDYEYYDCPTTAVAKELQMDELTWQFVTEPNSEPEILSLWAFSQSRLRPQGSLLLLD